MTYGFSAPPCINTVCTIMLVLVIIWQLGKISKLIRSTGKGKSNVQRTNFRTIFRAALPHALGIPTWERIPATLTNDQKLDRGHAYRHGITQRVDPVSQRRRVDSWPSPRRNRGISDNHLRSFFLSLMQVLDFCRNVTRHGATRTSHGVPEFRGIATHCWERHARGGRTRGVFHSEERSPWPQCVVSSGFVILRICR